MDYSQLPKPKERIQYLLEHGINYMNEWEKEFVDCLELRLSQGFELTSKQSRCLIRLHRKIEGIVG